MLHGAHHPPWVPPPQLASVSGMNAALATRLQLTSTLTLKAEQRAEAAEAVFALALLREALLAARLEA